MDCVLNQPHQQEVYKFLTFFEQKRKESLNEVHTSFSQFSSRIKEEIFSRSEVESLINELRDEVKMTLDVELQTIVYMSGVYVKILMSQAETYNFHLQGDVSFIENEKAIEEMRKIGTGEREVSKKTGGGRLPTLQGGDQARVKELVEEREGLKKKVLDLQGKISEMVEEIEKLRSGDWKKQGEIEVKEVNQVLEETKVRQR